MAAAAPVVSSTAGTRRTSLNPRVFYIISVQKAELTLIPRHDSWRCGMEHDLVDSSSITAGIIRVITRTRHWLPIPAACQSWLGTAEKLLSRGRPRAVQTCRVEEYGS